MEEQWTSILLNNTFTTINTLEAWQLRVRPIGSKWVYKNEYNPDGTRQYKAHLVIKGYEQTDFGETYALFGRLITFRHLISLVTKYCGKIDHLDVITTIHDPEDNQDNIHMTLPEGRPHCLNTPTIIVRL
jgi:hypothetical protein